MILKRKLFGKVAQYQGYLRIEIFNFQHNRTMQIIYLEKHAWYWITPWSLYFYLR